MNDTLLSVDVGAWVRCERTAPSKGTWPRYAGRVGRVVCENGLGDELGVRFTANHSETTTWFQPTELVETVRPRRAPDIKVTPTTIAVAAREARLALAGAVS